MKDGSYLLIFAVITILPAVVASYRLATMKPGWSLRRIALLSPLPVPLLVLLAAAFVFIRTMIASKEDCGVDACGMAMAAAIILAFCAGMVYLIAAGIAFLVARMRRK